VADGTSAGGKDVAVHYSPDEDLSVIDSSLLLSAQSEISISAYSFTDPLVADALAQRAEHGVRVRIYRDRGETRAELDRRRSDDPIIVQLSRIPGIEVRVKGASVLAHLKAYEVDGKVLRTGSANFSPGAEKSQDNDLVIVHDPTAVAAFVAKFDEMWNRPDNEGLR
jgi:phosphatidylserine/phosphatidylglycerophosphate/cardiolipin synthase-like enzyme